MRGLTPQVADLAVVVALACEVADRSNAEQRALLNVARRVDNDSNIPLSSNTRMWRFDNRAMLAYRLRPESRLEAHAHETRTLLDDQRPVVLPALRSKPIAQRIAPYRLVEEWET